jgi:hypothetical protein
LESLGVRFSTEGIFGRVSEAFSPHSFIPEECLQDLAEFKHLKRLDLTGSHLSDAGISRLSEMKQLEQVNISMTVVTHAQLKTLMTALPNCVLVGELIVPTADAPSAPD